MTILRSDQIALVIQFLREEKLNDTVHMLEQESGLFFNMEYFEEKVLDGEWDDVEKYLSGFTIIDDNKYSTKMYFSIRKQKYLEALDRNNKGEAAEILLKELKEFSKFNQNLYNELTILLTLENFRENEELSNYRDTKSTRNNVMLELKRLLGVNPLFEDKLNFPSFKASRLRTLINQSLNWQHQLCKNPKTNPEIKTLLVDHNCSSSNGSVAIARLSSHVPQGSHVDPSPQGTPQEVHLPFNDLPTTAICTLYHSSSVTSMDFHPSLHSLLVVGCSNGEISLCEARIRERLIFKPFMLWNISACSDLFQARIRKDSSISINRVSWSPKGDFIGVAFAKHLIHLYAYEAPKDLNQHLEIDAHVGSVNDLTFSYSNKQLCIVTCGDDKLIKVWDLNGEKLFNFEGHGAPVYSIYSHQIGNFQFIFSTDFEGKVKIWEYGKMDSVTNYDAPGQCCTKILYSSDGSRLFSCGTSKAGDSFLVEWNQSNGEIKTTYSGLEKKSNGVVQFDTFKSRFLAVGENNQIKFWDMNKIHVMTTTFAGGGLPCLPLLKFNKAGNLLAVTTKDNGLKILANTDDFKYSRAIGARFCETSKTPVLTKCRTLTMPQKSMTPTKKVACLYTKSGDGLLALGSDGIHKLWKWSINELNSSGKATASVVPQHWRPNRGSLMTNDVPENSEATISCALISNNGYYVLSTCGGKVSVFNILTFERLVTCMPPPPTTTTSTSLAFHPRDNNIIVIGREDSEILIYSVRRQKINHILRGHKKHITGLAFSVKLNLLVSSGADAQLFFWSMNIWWQLKKSLSIQMPFGNAPVGDTGVQFHTNQVNLLVWHATQLAIYDASKMELIQQWMPQDGLSGSITSATFSCNGQLVYATFTDGNIGVFDFDNLKLRCCIASSAYLRQISSNSQNVYPLVIAAHPHEPNQFAIGLTDGSVKVIEPIEFEGRWGN